jgi:hypothetical protein
MFWPRIILWGLLPLSLILAGNGWFGRTHATSNEDPGPSLAHLKKSLGLVLIGSVYFFFLDILGFLLATLLLTGTVASFLQRRRLVEIAAFSMVVPAVVWLAFIKLLNLPLPRGIGIFRELSLLLY